MWITLTVDDVLNEGLTPQEVATLKNIQGNTDLLPGFLAGVVEEARGAVRAGGYALGDAGKIPSQLRSTVIDITTWRWLKKFPALKALQTKERQDANRAAQTRLQDVTKQKENIEPPTTDATTQPRPGQWNSENKMVMRGHPLPTPATQFPSGDANRPYANPEGTEDV